MGLAKEKQSKKNIPVVILCGGMGTRLVEYTEVRPKPLVEIGGKPILWHIMKHYSRYGFNEFFLALGYKGEHIKRYFLDYNGLNQDFTISLSDGKITNISQNASDPWKVHLIDTGQTTLTGGRIKHLASMINQEKFMMTYGDGVSNVNIDALLEFHKNNRGLVTLTAVRPPARFGALEFEGNQIRHFKEKSILHEGWINGGFFVIEAKALSCIKEDVMWEHAPMEHLAEKGQLYAYKHEGFWQCMDTVRDLNYLEEVWQTGKAPWRTW
jgi:glucose-1-phosphate cytidylyltransferase